MTTGDEELAAWASALSWTFPLSFGVACGATNTSEWAWVVAVVIGVAYWRVSKSARKRALELLDELRRDHSETVESKALAIARLWQ